MEHLPLVSIEIKGGILNFPVMFECRTVKYYSNLLHQLEVRDLLS